MTDVTEQAQRTDLLIANGQQTADLLRHLADNHIDSDYFAVTSECEAYGTEIDAELTITDFALRAAGYVDALVEALEARDKQIAELRAKDINVKRQAQALFDAIQNPDDAYIPAYVRCLRNALAGVSVEGE
nr:hypothetical protein [Escherichia coli]